MKKGILNSYLSGITDFGRGEKYSTIISYLCPELITSFLLFSMPFWLDASFVSHLKSTTTYATLGATNNLLHLMIKMSEALSVGAIVLVGRFNGAQEFSRVGRVLKDTFWTTVFVGGAIASFLYFGAYWIYAWYGVPQDMIAIGIPFLRVRALGVFCSFIFMALIGFLRGIKNTRVPMKIFMLGSATFVFFDYALIFGKFGFPALGLQGSATASVIQYLVMLSVAIGYALFSADTRKYSIQLFKSVRDKNYFFDLIKLSWPVLLDKTTMAMAYVWLCKMICPMGTNAIATFSVVKDMERFALLPGIACAQVITFLVSNDYGAQNWQGIKTNIKKVIFLATSISFFILLFFATTPNTVIQIFDKKGDFSPLAVKAFPLLSVLVFFDLLQLILAGALRGAGNVKMVMATRIFVCLALFAPISYIISSLPIQSVLTKFVLIYGSFYMCNGVMSLIYINRFRGEKWKKRT